MTAALTPLPSTRWPRVALAWALGALSGGVLTALDVWLWELREDIDGTPPLVRFGFSPGIAMIAAVAYALGLLAVAAPGWWGLHKLGFRGWRSAAALGMVLNAVVMAGTDPFPTGHAISLAAEFGVIGAVVGLIVWRAAYRKALPA